MHKRAFNVALVLSIVLGFSSRSFAWIDTGHKIVAMIAWEDLTPKTKAAVTELLKQHARYEKDLLLNSPDGATDDQLAQHAFAMAATWPDMIRNRNHPMTVTHNHPQWHYIDIPFEDGAKAVEPPSDSPGPHNCVEALTQCTNELKSNDTSPDNKAIDLCWIEHLVGDVHQPLHAVSRYSPQFPKGDQGGNAEILLKDPPYPDSAAKLHLIWDEMPGDYRDEFVDHYIANGVRSDPNYTREALKDLIGVHDFMAWAKESHDMAVHDAYLDGKLEAGVNSRGGGHSSTQPTPGLPPGYKEQAEKDAMHQVALAGYRLADLLNSIFDSK